MLFTLRLYFEKKAVGGFFCRSNEQREREREREREGERGGREREREREEHSVVVLFPFHQRDSAEGAALKSNAVCRSANNAFRPPPPPNK